MVTQLNESDPAIHRWVALSRLLMYGSPEWIDNLDKLSKFRPGWNAVMDEFGTIFQYVFIGKGQGMSRIDPPSVAQSEIHSIPHESAPKILLVFHMVLTSALLTRDDLEDSVKSAIRNVSEKIVDFANMSSREICELAEQPMWEVEEQFNQQFFNIREIRLTGYLAWVTVKAAHDTVSKFLSFELPGLAAALRLISIHFVHCKALNRWSSRNRVYDYLDKNINHLHRRTFILLNESCENATLESAGHMMYLSWLYGLTAMLLSGIKVIAEEHPDEFFSGELTNLNLKGMASGRRAKAIDELIVHRALPAFTNPALGIRYKEMTMGEENRLDLFNNNPFIYPQLKERVPLKHLRKSSQQELFDLIRAINSELKDMDVLNSVMEGDNQPFDLESFEVFAAQQIGRNLMHMILRKINEKEKPENDGNSEGSAT
jgi:hypothetical protein